MALRIVINIILILVLLSIPSVSVSAKMRVILTVVVCILFHMNNEIYMKEIKEKYSIDKCEVNSELNLRTRTSKVLLVAGIVVGLICGMFLLISW